jgi:hypothetical protein
VPVPSLRTKPILYYLTVLKIGFTSSNGVGGQNSEQQHNNTYSSIIIIIIFFSHNKVFRQLETAIKTKHQKQFKHLCVQQENYFATTLTRNETNRNETKQQ